MKKKNVLKKRSYEKLSEQITNAIAFRLNPHKWMRWLALAAGCFMFVFLLASRKLFLNADTLYGGVLFTFCLLAVPLTVFLLAFRIRVSEKAEGPFFTILFFLMPVAEMQMVEAFNGKFIYNFSVQTFLLNYAFYLCFFLIVYLCSGRYHLCVLISAITLYVFGIINYFVDLFRGTPLLPMDIPTIGTGMEVADGYEYSLSWNLITASIIMLLIYLINRQMVNVQPKRKIGKVTARLFSAGYIAILLSILFFTNTLANYGYKPDFWNQSRGYHTTGTWLNFCLNLKYLHVNKPTGYDANELEQKVDDLLNQYETDGNSKTSVNMLTGKDNYKATGKTPNVICIMNESLADLSTLGDLQTNADALSYVHSMGKNTIKGLVQVPVFGAGTSNSEYEFLSGDSISYLPAGSNVYQSYIKHSMPTLVSYMKSLGYSRTAFHPYYAEGWNRENVYKYFGFEDFISIEDFIDADILDQYKKDNDSWAFEQNLKERYPGKNMLLRRFISDNYDYKMIEDMYEKRDRSKPFFLFNVTMQNHGGYSMDYDNFDQKITIQKPQGYYDKATRYLSLVKYSDNAIKKLINYFKKVKEPTVICIFGDHQPAIEDTFYESLYGTSLNSLNEKQQQQRYTTPFIIWANFDIPNKTVKRISTNYLSTLVCQTAGLPMTKYQKYLSAMYQKLPVMDTIGYIDKNDNYYSYDDNTKYSKLIQNYRCLEYNHLFDYKHRQNQIFNLQTKKSKSASAGS